jgi:hypothetical protein
VTIRSTIALGLAVALLSTGCARYLGRAKRDYVQGRYLEASEVLGAHEADLEILSPRGQAEYGVYRGLSLLMLGDHQGAYRWLAFAHQLEHDAPGTLEPETHGALQRGFAELVKATGDPRYGAPAIRSSASQGARGATAEAAGRSIR